MWYTPKIKGIIAVIAYLNGYIQLKGIPGAVRDAGPDAWGRRVIEHKRERSAADLVSAVTC